MKTPVKKARTPSGTTISQSAKDIRGYFEKESQKAVARTLFSGERREWVKQNKALIADPAIVKRLRTTRHAARNALSAIKAQSVKDEVNSVKVNSNQPTVTKCKLVSVTTKTSEGIIDTPRPDKILGSKLKKKTEKSPKRRMTSKEVNAEALHLKSQTAPKAGITEEIAEAKAEMVNMMKQLQNVNATPDHAESIETQSYQARLPETISLTTVVSMFKKMEEKLDKIEQKASGGNQETLMAEINKINTRMSVIERMAATKGEVRAIKKEVTFNKFVSKVQNGSLSRTSDVLEEITNRLDAIELNNNKRALTVSNLQLSEEKSKAIQDVEQFFLDTMDFKPDIEDVFKIGGGRGTATVVVVFVHLLERNFILQNKAILKGVYTNGKQHYINKYLPTAINEKRRRDREITSVLSSTDVSLSFERGKLKVDGQYYHPPVNPPKPEMLTELSLEELDEILTLPVSNGDKFVKDNNIFIGFTIAVSNHALINRAYLKIRLLHPRARHILCAYILSNEDTLEQKGFCDDGEIGGGRALLQVLEQNRMEARAVFIVRYFGDNKIGNDRYTCMENAAISALESNCYNSVLKSEQPVTSVIAVDNSNNVQELQGGNDNRGRGVRGQYRSGRAYRNNFRGRANYQPRGSATVRGSYRGALMTSKSNRRGNFYSRYARPQVQGYSNMGNRQPAQPAQPTHSAQPAQRSNCSPHIKRRRTSPNPLNQFSFSNPESVSTSAAQSEDEYLSDYQPQVEDWSNEHNTEPEEGEHEEMEVQNSARDAEVD